MYQENFVFEAKSHESTTTEKWSPMLKEVFFRGIDDGIIIGIFNFIMDSKIGLDPSNSNDAQAAEFVAIIRSEEKIEGERDLKWPFPNSLRARILEISEKNAWLVERLWYSPDSKVCGKIAKCIGRMVCEDFLKGNEAICKELAQQLKAVDLTKTA